MAKRSMTALEKDHSIINQSLDQLWCHIRQELNAEHGLMQHIGNWTRGQRTLLSPEDKANIRLLTQAGLMYVHAMNLRQAIVEGT